MTRLLSIIFLLIVWDGISNEVTLVSSLTGIVFIIFLQLVILPRQYRIYFNPFYFLLLALFVIVELVISSLQVAWDILTPRRHSEPRFFEVKTQCYTTSQLSLLANLISLTPGTLTVDVNQERNCIVIHAMFGHSQKSVTDFIQNKLEKLVIKAMPHAMDS